MTVSSSIVQPSQIVENKATPTGVEIPQDTPYQSLSRSTLFPDLDQYQYWHQVAPMLGKMLADGEYSIHRQYEYLSVFAHLIIPILGPFPGGRNLYKCLLGGIGSVELSQNFQKGTSTARLAFEPTGYIASTGSDPFNRITINTMLSRLKAMGTAVNLQLHQMLVNELTLTDREQQLIAADEVERITMKTQTLLAFDLTKTGINVKEYFYPDMKARVTGQSVSQIIFAAIRKMDERGHFESPCNLLQSHMQRQSQTDLYFLSCDLVDPLHTRMKVYLTELEVTLAKVKEHWTLSGMVTDEETVEGLQMLQELWADFGIVEGKRSRPERPTKPGDPSTHLPCIFNYEMSPGKSIPKQKFYFPLTGIPEMRIAKALVSFFQRHDMHDQAAVYIKNLRSYYPGENLDAITDHQAWLSFSYTKKAGPYVTMYYH